MRYIARIAAELLDHKTVRACDHAESKIHFNKMQALLDSKDPKARHHKKRILDLKAAEENKDLCLLEYNSWILPGQAFQAVLRDKLDPVFWGSVYFEAFNFVKYLPELCEAMRPEMTGIFLKGTTGYQVLILSSRSTKWETSHALKSDFAKHADQLLVFGNDGIKNVLESYAPTLDSILNSTVESDANK